MRSICGSTLTLLVAYLLQFSSNSDDIPYVLLVVEAEEFCNLVINETLMEHVSHVRSRYPSHTICYVTNRLMAYINKRFDIDSSLVLHLFILHLNIISNFISFHRTIFCSLLPDSILKFMLQKAKKKKKPPK